MQHVIVLYLSEVLQFGRHLATRETTIRPCMLGGASGGLCIAPRDAAIRRHVEEFGRGCQLDLSPPSGPSQHCYEGTMT